MINKKFFSLFICLICTISFANAEKIEAGSLKEPNDKKIVLIGKVSVKKPIDIEARREAFSEMKIKQKDKSKDDTFYFIGEKTYPENAPAFGETFFAIIKYKDGKYTIPYFTGTILPHINEWFRFALPANVTVIIPEDAKYVYIGNFEYELDYALRVIGFKHYDEYTSAQKELDKALDSKATMYRAELKFN